MCSLCSVGADSVRRGPWGSGSVCSLCSVGTDSVRRGPWGSGFVRSLCSVGTDSVRCGPWGSGFMFAVFRGNGLGKAWPVGVGVYVFAVFRGSRLVIRRGPWGNLFIKYTHTRKV